MKTATAPDEMHRVMDVAKKLKIGRTRIYELMNSGQLAYTEVGNRCRRISQAQFESFLRSASRRREIGT